MKNLISILQLIGYSMVLLSGFIYLEMLRDKSDLAHYLAIASNLGFFFFAMVLIVGTIAAFMIVLLMVLYRREVERHLSLSMREKLAEIGTFRERGYVIIGNIIKRFD